MRPSQQKNRMRGRGRKQSNPLSRNFESNGPDVKIRGNAAHIAEKYATLARDAASAGDRVIAENYLQHAEHYNRIIAAAAANASRNNEDQANTARTSQSDSQPDIHSGETNDSDSDDDNFNQDNQSPNQRSQPKSQSADEVVPSDSTEDMQPVKATEPQESPRKPRRRPRKTESAAKVNGNGADASPRADKESETEGPQISSDAAKLPSNLLGISTDDNASAGVSQDD
jgi:hypothetical protein